MTYTILDLFCGAGGAAKGYADAGFSVVGVDIIPQPHYPYEFYQVDAVEYLKAMVTYGFSGIDAVHASPPCQRWSMMSKCRPGLAEKYPDLIEPVRFLLLRVGLPYVIENVVGAPLRDPVMMCGTMFGLGAQLPRGYYELRRHRLFEAGGFEIPSPGRCDHHWRTIPVYGHSRPGNRPDLRGQRLAGGQRRAMQTPWMTRDDMAEAIPPAFTRWAGAALMASLDGYQDAA